LLLVPPNAPNLRYNRQKIKEQLPNFPGLPNRSDLGHFAPGVFPGLRASGSSATPSTMSTTPALALRFLALAAFFHLGLTLEAAEPAAPSAPSVAPAATGAPAASRVLNEAIPDLPPPPSATAEPHVNTAAIPYPQYYDDALMVGRGNIPTFNRLHAANVARAKKGDIDLLFLGDSITQFWGSAGKAVWAANFGTLKAANFGVSADRTQNVLWRLQHGEGEGFQPKVILLMIGTNNLGPEVDNKTPRNTPADIAAGIAAIVGEIRTRFPAAKTLLLGILPREAKGDPDRKDLEEVNRNLTQSDDGV
jgi:hypothetical protein